MLLKAPLLFVIVFFIGLGFANAQFEGPVFTYDTSVKVYDQLGNLQTMAWCGGFNRPQFAMGDLNNDKIPDLVAFEPFVGIKTFINTGSQGSPKYVYAPQYALN